MTLTPRQLQLLKLIQEAQARQCVGPTLTELAESMGCLLNAIADKVTALERKGALSRVKGVHRGLRLTDAGLQYLASHGPEATTPAA